MRWKQLIELTKVNLLYANPQILEKKRSQEAAGKSSGLSAPMTVIGQSLLILIFFSFIYGLMIQNYDFVQYPGFFTFFLAMFILMTILQGFYIIFNLFYESKDLTHYLPLPFKSSEVFIAKFVVIVITVIPFLSPAFAVFYRLGRDADYSVMVSLLISVALFTLLTLVVFLLAIVIVHLISRLSLFQKHKKVMTTALYTLASAGMVGVIIWLTNTGDPVQNYQPGFVLPDYPLVPFLHHLHPLIVNPFGQEALIGLGWWLLLLVILVLTVYKFVLPGIYEQSEGVRDNRSAGRRKKQIVSSEPVSIERTLLKYNFSLIQDSTLMMQYLSTNIMFPVMMIGPVFISPMTFETLAVSTWWGLFFFMGYMYSFLTLTSISIVGVIISLERENYLYIKSLPISLKYYLQHKFWFGFAVQWLLPVIITSVMMILVDIPFLLAVCFHLGLALGIYTLSEQYFVRDYRNLSLQWQNLTELFTRGGGNFIQAIRILGVIMVAGVVIAGVIFLMSALPSVGRLLLSLLLVVVPAGFTFSRVKSYQQKFWGQLD